MAGLRALQSNGRATAAARYLVDHSLLLNLSRDTTPLPWTSSMEYVTRSGSGRKNTGGWERCGRAGEMDEDDYGTAWDDGYDGQAVEAEIPHWNSKKKEVEEKKKNNGKKSFKVRTEKYMRPFVLDVFLSTKYIHSSIMHRVTSKVVAVANTNAKEFRSKLKSYKDFSACKIIGQTLAERAKEADVYSVLFELRKGEKYEGRLAAIVGTVIENGINVDRD